MGAAGLLAAPLVFATAVTGAPRATPLALALAATQRITVEVRGPVALVEVTRALPPEGPGGAERVLDVALPDHAALVDLALDDAGSWRSVEAQDPARAVKDYLGRLEGRGVAPRREPFDDATTYRLRVSADAAADVGARYRFVVPCETSEGRRRLRFPASAERMPAAADIAVTGTDGGDVVIAGGKASGGGDGRTARGHASTRGAWEISWAPRVETRGSARLDGGVAFAKVAAAETLVAVSAEARARPPREPPGSVLMLLDRSSSVGLPGLAAERDLAGRLLEALPPSTRFDALLFDRRVVRLFPMTRPATREALGALDGEMVPDRLRNGTDLAGALREAGDLLRREASAFAPRAWLAIVTDGALPEGQDGAALTRALGAVPGVEVTVAVWVVRPKGDDDAPAPAVRALRALAASRGGVVRTLAPDELDDGLAASLAALARGGDVADVRVTLDGREHALADRLAPGEGVARTLRLGALGAGPVELTGAAGDGPARARLRPRRVDARWLRALAGDDTFGTRLLATERLVALVEHGPRVVHASDTVHGSLDRTVVRNTLALAFMPRARACYLNRTAATPALRDLTGRVRLAIDLTRGEVGDVVVQSSTLNHPGIEACLREGAFSLEVPRTLRSDSPSTAVLNLVFRPRTPEKAETPEEAALGEQIDLVIERADLPGQEPPPVDRSMIPTR